MEEEAKLLGYLLLLAIFVAVPLYAAFLAIIMQVRIPRGIATDRLSHR